VSPDTPSSDERSSEAPRTIGRYALHAEIASGGMATIHIGRLLGPVGFARTVAIKRLHPPLAKDPEFVAMFLDEARLAARIRHPNVVSTLDVVATEGELFVVMEYVPGESLARLLRAVRTAKEMVPVPVAGSIMVGVLHGLHAAHEARDERGDPLRIVHRDVSPHNILVGTDGDAHLIDFGIAKARGRMQVTRQGQIKGKLSYMPAEQLMGQALDHRADIFAASIVLWEALTGQRLFQGTDDGDVYAKVLLGKVDPPSLHAKSLNPEVDAIVLRGLSRDRAKRYATAREMALALEAAIPLAPPSQVGRWVEGLVGDALAERTEQIAGIERLVESSSSDATSSALMTIGGGASAPANQQNEGLATGARPAPLSKMDRTDPTQPLGGRPRGMTDPTIVDRPAALSTTKDPVVVVTQGAKRRRSGRWLAVLVLVVLALSAVAGVHTLRANPTPSAPALAATIGPVETHEAPPPPPVPSAQTASDWHPVAAPSLPAVPASPDPQSAATTGSTKKAPPPTIPSARPASRGQATTQATETAEAPAAPPATTSTRPSTSSPASCDPPFYIDADGTKRYKRYCAGL
jgi:serine/threonine-protein kinase